MIIAIVIFILVALISYYALFPKKNGLPPQIYGWPIIGHIPSLKKPLTESVNEFRKKLGDIFLWKIGSREFLFVCNYDLVKATLNNPQMQDRPEMLSILFFGDGQFSGISVNNGENWHKVRKFSQRYLKDRGIGKSSLLPEIEIERDYLIKELKKMIKEDRNISPWCINTAITNVIWKMCADKRYEVDDKDFQQFEKTMNDLFNEFQSTVNIAMDFMPWLQRVLPTFIQKWITKGFTEKLYLLYDFLKEIVEETKTNKDPSRPQTMIDVYLEEMAKGKNSEYYGALSEHDLLVTLADLFTAGGDTTSSTIKWILMYLAKYPHIQDKVYEEISTVVPSDRYPNLDDRLPYTTAVFYEVIRSKPLLPFNFYHCAAADTMLGKYKIPKDTVIMPCIYACHTDPKLFKKPLDFYPEHFLNDDGSLNTKPEGFIPFGMGPRVCIGQSLAKTNLQIMATALLQQFEIKPVDGEEISLEADLSQPLFHLPPMIKLQFCEREA